MCVWEQPICAATTSARTARSRTSMNQPDGGAGLHAGVIEQVRVCLCVFVWLRVCTAGYVSEYISMRSGRSKVRVCGRRQSHSERDEPDTVPRASRRGSTECVHTT